MSVAAVRQPPYPVRVQQRRCGKCGKLVSRAAYACRRCGKSQRMRPRIIMLMLAALLMVGMFAVAGMSAVTSTGRVTDVTAPASAAVAAGPIVSPRVVPGRTSDLTAGDLWSAYSRDRAGAERLYRDRSVEVSGLVRAVEHNYEGDVVVRLATPDPFEAVNATLATRNDPAVFGLAKGHHISLLCVGRGELMGAPLLGSCFVK